MLTKSNYLGHLFFLYVVLFGSQFSIGSGPEQPTPAWPILAQVDQNQMGAVLFQTASCPPVERTFQWLIGADHDRLVID
jgi:hypothetical protein